MELKEGYQKTEVGTIPEDWIVTNAYNVCDLIVDCKNRTPPVVEGDEYAVVRTPNVRDGKFVKEELRFTDKQSFKIWTERAIPQVGDIMITREAPLGEVCSVPKNLKVCLGQRMMLYRPSENLNSNYLLYSLMSKEVRTNLLRKIGGSTVGHAKVDDIRYLEIALPPTTTEQNAIATALSDTDALITSIEELIAKKRLIKQGAMQKLLSPKESWKVKSLPSVIWYQEGPGVRNSQFTNSGVKLLNGTNIEKGKLLLDKTNRFISKEEAFGWYSHFLVKDGDILIACSGVTIDKFEEKVTIATESHLPLCMNTSTMRFKVISEDITKEYFFHFLKSKVFKKQIGGKATGSAQLNFGPSHVKMVEISLPKREEQTQIATILSDIDTEIEALETKLAKYKQIKQGMMQNLLTGKIRLV